MKRFLPLLIIGLSGLSIQAEASESRLPTSGIPENQYRRADTFQAPAKCSAQTSRETSPCNGNLEAQFIAQYNHINFTYAETGGTEHTIFDLKNFRHYSVNQNCPLELEIALQAKILEDRILSNVREGDEVSGVLVYNPRTHKFFIE